MFTVHLIVLSSKNLVWPQIKFRTFSQYYVMYIDILLKFLKCPLNCKAKQKNRLEVLKLIMKEKLLKNRRGMAPAPSAKWLRNEYTILIITMMHLMIV